MYLRWLDGWDERQAVKGDANSAAQKFAIDGEFAYPDIGANFRLEDLCSHSQRNSKDGRYFLEPSKIEPSFDKATGLVRFASSISTDVTVNNMATAKVTESRVKNRAILIFHHWGAGSRYDPLAKVFAACGVTAVEATLPYHLDRSRNGIEDSNLFVSASLGRTLQSVQQAVADGRTLVRWLEANGYKEIYVFGMSLGTWVAGFVAALEPTVSRLILCMTGSSVADVIWSGRATETIRSELKANMDLGSLRRAWDPINLGNCGGLLARPRLKTQIFLAKRDTLILPEISDDLIDNFTSAGVDLSVVRVNCGHYSMSLPQYIIPVLFRAMRFIRI